MYDILVTNEGNKNIWNGINKGISNGLNLVSQNAVLVRYQLPTFQQWIKFKIKTIQGDKQWYTLQKNNAFV